jgi:hypothetical protein
MRDCFDIVIVGAMRAGIRGPACGDATVRESSPAADLMGLNGRVSA